MGIEANSQQSISKMPAKSDAEKELDWAYRTAIELDAYLEARKRRRAALQKSYAAVTEALCRTLAGKW